MTERARLVLEDARAVATELLSGCSSPHDESTMRRQVILIMALLRTVGHVLKEVDTKTSTALCRAVEEKWKQPRPLMFTEFIDGYRAAVLKRYEQPEIDFDMEMGTLYPRLTIQYGGATGVSFDYLVQEAIKYWEQYLGDVDHLASMYESEV